MDIGEHTFPLNLQDTSSFEIYIIVLNITLYHSHIQEI